MNLVNFVILRKCDMERIKIAHVKTHYIYNGEIWVFFESPSFDHFTGRVNTLITTLQTTHDNNISCQIKNVIVNNFTLLK